MKLETSKILNAYRMGVIPDTLLEPLMVAREHEVETLMGLLKEIKTEGYSCVKYIKGEYGSGKTFLLNYFRQKALEDGFVVASISITSGFNFSRLDSIYTSIMGSLEIKDKNGRKGTSFEEIFEAWINGLKKEEITQASKDIYEVISQLNDYNNAFSQVLLTYIRAKIKNDYDLANIAASWIKGDSNISYELKRKLNVKGSVDTQNAISMLKSFNHLLSLIGYSGIVILVDEIELIMNNRMDTRQKAFANIRYLMDICGSSELEKCIFLFAGTDELFDNEDRGFKSYDALYQRIGINMTDGKNSVKALRQPIIELKAFTKEQLYIVTTMMLKLHEEHYKYNCKTEIDTIYRLVIIEYTKLYKDQTITLRNFLKKLIELLDQIEKNPNLPIFNTKISSIKINEMTS